jgi:hypothetical protein
LNSRLRPTDYREELGPAFVRLFGDQPKRAAEAGRALAAAGIDPPLVDELAVALGHAAKYDAAVQLHEALPGGPAAATMFRMRAAGAIQKWKGRDAAVAYLRKRLPVKNDNEGRRLLMMGWREEKQLVWDLVPDPAGTGDDAEQIWLMRAAALAQAGKDAPPARLEAAKAHYAKLEDKSRHPQLGRYLLGEVSEADAAKLVTNISASCEVPFYFGVKAEGEARLADAADWYAVALECGVRTEAEYLYAYDALYALRVRGAPFERFR